MDKNIRSREEIDSWIARDPIPRFAALLVSTGRVAEDDLRTIDEDVERTIDDAIEFARSSPFPDPSTLLAGVYR